MLRLFVTTALATGIMLVAPVAQVLEIKGGKVAYRSGPVSAQFMLGRDRELTTGPGRMSTAFALDAGYEFSNGFSALSGVAAAYGGAGNALISYGLGGRYATDQGRFVEARYIRKAKPAGAGAIRFCL